MRAKLEARELTEDDFVEWDRLVEESPQGTTFNTTDWLRTCAKTWRGKTRIWGCFRKNKLVGGCALRVLNFGFLKRAANSSMMTPYDGIIQEAFQKEAKLRAHERLSRNVINSLCSLLEQLSFVRLNNSPALLDIRPFTLRKWVPKVKYTYILNPSEVTLEDFSTNIKKSIRKAEKYDIRVEKSNDGSTYFELYKSMLLRKNAPPPSAKLKLFFQQIVELLYQKNLGELWFAKTPSGEIAAGEIIVFDNKRAYRWGAASSGDYLHTKAPTFLTYEVIKHLKDRFNEFDMGGADIPKLHKHKADFNPKIVPRYTVEKTSLTTQILYSALKKANESLKGLFDTSH